MASNEYDESYEIEETKPTAISLHLIVRRHLPAEAQKWSHDKIENIGRIDSLELLGKKVTNVYLQHNRIPRLENLDCLPNLTFLMLAENQINRIEGLSHLHKLAFLDLSQNQIKSFDIDELPQSLVVLSLKCNPCTKLPDYRGSIVQDLPNLKQLDGIDVTKTEKFEAGFQVSSSGEESSGSDEEPVDPYGQSSSSVEDTFRDAATDILLRSQSRLEDAMQQHLNNVAELDDIRIKEDLPPSARYMSVRLAASAKLSASRSSSALREQLRAARAAASSSVPVRVHKT